ncbi:stimulator of interferon genes protein isoform X3 [Microcaecilia unicolor]|uniref:Stimulator of interferon genes protein n=1 Tax=Microcaecilia unicolor TaxID=1415580 RepID=A0A6P7YZM9_9AMPH|nr:stimulator of interferon genes protein isoform X3 [Microcaecilia unicolor]
MFWTCSKVQSFWVALNSHVSQIWSIIWQPHPNQLFDLFKTQKPGPKWLTAFLKRTVLMAKYQGKYSKAATACINIKHFLLLLLCGCFFLAQIDVDSLTNLSKLSNIVLVCISHLLLVALGLQQPTTVEVSEICEKQKMNVAHGLAWSFYLGYLKLVLPNLKKAISSFNKENSNLLWCEETCKLHILIPLSCKIHSNLSEVDSNIQFLKDLPLLYIDRAGVKGRVYKNSIYKIFDEDQRPHYCIVEYATPLLTLYEMSGTTSAGFSSEDRLQQAKLFYTTLKDILESSLDCRNCYRLVVYDDGATSEDEAQNTHFLSQEILWHMQQQTKEEYSFLERNNPSTASSESKLMLSYCESLPSLHNNAT